MNTLEKTLTDLFERKKHIQESNKKETETVDNEILVYKQLQEQMKSEQISTAEMKV